MLNRAAVILRYKEPAVRWINEADPAESAPGIDLESANQERTVYLISDKDGEAQIVSGRWIRRNWAVVFEQELEGWYTEPSLWPQKRTLKLFKEWFDVECHTCLIDTVGIGFHDDGL